MSEINDALLMYRSALRQEMKKAHWFQLPVFGEMIGHIGGTDSNGYPLSVPFGATRTKTLQPTGMPIEVLTDFKHQGGWDIDCPLVYPLTDEPIYGDNPKIGNEEKRKWAYQKAYINAVWSPVLTKDGLMGEQALTPKLIAQLMKNNQRELILKNRKWQAYAPYDSLCRKYSRNMLSNTPGGTGGGPSLTQASHPNFFVAGTGQATWHATAATYETNTATALDTLAGGGATTEFTPELIEYIITQASNLKITATTIAGRNVIGTVIIHQAQANQLFKNENFRKELLALVTKEGGNTPLFSGSLGSYLYRGVLLLVDINAPGVWTAADGASYDSTRGTVNYGSANPLANPIMTSNRKLAFYLGASAVLCGHTVSLGFEKENWDYKSKESEASYTVVGYNRADIYDNDGKFGPAGLFKENSSSLIIATYSPNTPSF